MRDTDRIIQWNRWYDSLPQEWRFHFVLWPVLAVGAFNMLLTVALGFPFGLLLLFGFAFICAVRVPYVLGYLHASDPNAPAGTVPPGETPWWIRPFV